MKTLYLAVIADGYLYGAADADESPSAHSAYTPYWIGLRIDEDTDGFTILEARDVPDEIAEDLLSVGSPAQTVADGYEAMGLAAPYIARVSDEYGDGAAIA